MCKQSEPANFISIMRRKLQLPEPIIQHIQFFLTGKEAARTTVLSKSWHSAWLTRPNLDFDYDEFQNVDADGDDEGSRYEFLEFAKKTIQRYEESNLNIETFRLHMGCKPHVMFDLSSELIVRGLKIGATHLSFRYTTDFVLPREVFEAENLVELSLQFCKIEINSIKCLRLKCLNLHYVEIGGSYTIYNIISSCPLIQKLSLSLIFNIRRAANDRSTPCPIDLPMLCQLKCLLLCEVEFETLWCFGDWSSKFPSLQDLTLQNCMNVREVCCPSLEHLTFYSNQDSMVEFDVPSICEFRHEGSHIPLVCFKSTSSGYWESHVSIIINCDSPLSTSWFLELNQLLTELSKSKTYLSLDIDLEDSFDYEVVDFEGLPKPQVENVTVNMDYLPSLSCYALFDGLFRLCRPRFITLYLLPESSNGAKKNNDFVCKTLAQGMKGTCSSQSLRMYGLRDLEEVNVEIYDETVPVWKTLSLESLLDASKILTKEQKIRFKLKWNL
ncbi:hypothetical protein CASFOL_030359 [Castilleja foliolosa]|uniref:F-box family protein n=1 Tax=Castilleja foliolosa TaxID=1961234 RepID=A0ABD3CAQ6_9LAMI